MEVWRLAWEKLNRRGEDDREEFFYARDPDEPERTVLTVSHAHDSTRTYEVGIVFFCVDSDKDCARDYEYEAKRRRDSAGLILHMQVSYGMLLDFDRPDSLAPLRWRCRQVIDAMFARHRKAIMTAWRACDANSSDANEFGFGRLRKVTDASSKDPFDNKIVVWAGDVRRNKQANERLDKDERYIKHAPDEKLELWYFDLEKDELGRALLLRALYACPEYNAGVSPLAHHLCWAYMLGRTTRHLPSRIAVSMDETYQWSNPQMAGAARVHYQNKPFAEAPFDIANLQTMPEKAVRCSYTCWPYNLYYGQALDAFVTANPDLPYEGWIFTSGETWNLKSYFQDYTIVFIPNVPGELMMMAKHAKDERVADVVQWGLKRAETAGNRQVDWN